MEESGNVLSVCGAAGFTLCSCASDEAIGANFVCGKGRVSSSRPSASVSIDGGEPVTLVNENATQPDVSPDGNFVACFARRAGTPAVEIMVVPIGGGAPVATFALPSSVDPEWPGLRWTPDGTGLTYVVTEQGVSNVWRQAFSGGDAKPLTDFKENRIFFFDWSRNERKLVLVRGNDTRDLILVRDFLNANKVAWSNTNQSQLLATSRSTP